ncbi:MAG: prolyl-tRNA synthetase associated domain-containing protein [Clostridia bacterium]|nr:prolyl-tRNA synthetase associated domain-containing protein [Clostridia bacterium]
MELQKGRPADCTGRETRETAVYDLLDRLGIAYERTDHEEANTMEACNEIDRVLEVVICKNLFLCNRQQTKFYLLMMPGDKAFKTKDLSRQVGSSRLSFADAAHMEEYLHIRPGAVSIMGLMNDRQGRVQLLMDEEVAAGEYLGCHPCVSTSSLKLKMRDVLERFLPAVAHVPIMVQLPRYE